MGFYIKQIIKMMAQHVLFPIYYFICCRKPVTKGLVVFADEHKTACPPSMQRLHDALLLREELMVVDDFFNLQAMSARAGMRRMLAFMKLYAQAEFVILQDNFLPVSSCHKRKGTKVIQLWHGCGAFKRFGYDAQDDIPRFYKGNVYKNYDLVTVSSSYCRPFLPRRCGLRIRRRCGRTEAAIQTVILMRHIKGRCGRNSSRSMEQRTEEL